MGKNKKKFRRRRRRRLLQTARDRHHICYQERYWNRGYARAIRKAFTRPIPVIYHRELHSLLNTVPVPDGTLLRKAWAEYQKNADEIDRYDVARAAAWLYVHIPDPEFRKAMQFQVDFFATRFNKTV